MHLVREPTHIALDLVHIGIITYVLTQCIQHMGPCISNRYHRLLKQALVKTNQ
jgi:hypothetical protein